MAAYLMTHSLLSSWLYSMRDNPYEDATTERDARAEFLQVLRREPTPTNEAMQKGIDFEDMVTGILTNDPDKMNLNPKWFDAAFKVADIVGPAQLQHRARRPIRVGDMDFILYGRLDALLGGVIYDIKFSGSYDVGKFIDSTQHPTYMEIVPEAIKFVYVVTNGTSVWTETYRRDECRDIKDIIAQFMDWLTANGLMYLYKQHWLAK